MNPKSSTSNTPPLKNYFILIVVRKLSHCIVKVTQNSGSKDKDISVYWFKLINY